MPSRWLFLLISSFFYFYFSEDTVRLLLAMFKDRPAEEKKAFIDSSNDHGNTSLHWAALGGHLETVQILMDNGASPALANEQNYVALDLAAFNDHTEVSEYLLSLSCGTESSGGHNSELEKAAITIETAGEGQAEDDEALESLNH